jgi:TRAP-type C4-dicarboxylate transport system substrate-binding protein
MIGNVLRLIAMALALLPPAAIAAPIELKLSFFTSDRSSHYLNRVKPFVDAVNREGRGLVQINVFFGSISRDQADQPRLVSEGIADLAAIVPGRTPERFPDTTVMELPGLFRDQLQASLVFTRLIERGALQGYQDFLVVGAYVSGAESIHSRTPIASINDLKGATIRTNNQAEATVLERLGAKPVPIAINLTTEALSEGKIDAATFPPSMLFEFGIGRVTRYHYMIPLGSAPVALVMNRKTFENLPPQAQAIIRRYSGDWLAEQNASAFERLDNQILAQLKSDPRRKVVFPSPSDMERAQQVFASVVEGWAASSPHNRELLALVKAEIAKLQPSN